MKIEKDVIVAIIVGVLVGGLAAFFVFFFPKFFPKTAPPREKEALEIKKEDSFSPPSSFTLTVESPQGEAIFSEEKITVSGKTEPQTLVAILSPIDEAVTEADQKGDFKTTILLEEGVNEINITAYKEASPETQTVSVYYTKEEI